MHPVAHQTQAVFSPLMSLAILLIAGFMGGVFVRRFGLPMVTGYMLAGVAVGPYALGLLTSDSVNQLSFITDFVLGLIAFSIGEELEIKKLLRLGKNVVFITIGHVFLTFFLVSGFTLLLGKPLYYALILGAIATSTAPAATMLIIKEYRASGPLVDTLLASIVLADILSIISFGIAMSTAEAIIHQQLQIAALLWPILYEIGGSVILGIIIGLLLRAWIDRTTNDDFILIALLGMICLSCALAQNYHLSGLLVNMSSGIVIINFASHHHRAFKALQGPDAPMYVLFFALAGAILHLDKIPQIGLIGLLYILARSLGKIIGSTLGAWLSGADKKIKTWLGLALLPQAGVAIGFSLIVAQKFPKFGTEVVTIVFSTVIFFEIFGPLLSKIAIKRSDEAYQNKQIPTGFLEPQLPMAFLEELPSPESTDA